VGLLTDIVIAAFNGLIYYPEWFSTLLITVIMPVALYSSEEMLPHRPVMQCKKDTQKHWILSEVANIYINCLKLNLTLLRAPFLTDLFFHMCRLVFLSWLQFVQCLCVLFLFYLAVLIACMICFYYNVCDCHAFIKGNLLTYLMCHPPVRFCEFKVKSFSYD